MQQTVKNTFKVGFFADSSATIKQMSKTKQHKLPYFAISLTLIKIPLSILISNIELSERNVKTSW